jgi:SAM-dependent methyltransferase
MRALPPDYDSDPGRWQSWESPRDIHELVAPELRGPILDVGCGNGRLASLLGNDVSWIGVDSSPTQLAANPYRPVVQADMRALPFRYGAFAEVSHLWCLYHLPDPLEAITEAARVLRPGGRYFACSSARDNDPEIMYERYPLVVRRRGSRRYRRCGLRRRPGLALGPNVLPPQDPRRSPSVLPSPLHSSREG